MKIGLVGIVGTRTDAGWRGRQRYESGSNGQSLTTSSVFPSLGSRRTACPASTCTYIPPPPRRLPRAPQLCSLPILAPMKDPATPVPGSGLSSASPTVHDEPGISHPVDASNPNLPETDHAKAKSAEKNEPNDEDDGEVASSQDDVLIVDWDGPDDPMDPKKYVYLLALAHSPKAAHRTCNAHTDPVPAAGHTRRNGPPPRSSPRSPSSAPSPPP